MRLEIFPECELFGKTESVCYFLNLKVGVHQQVLGLTDSEQMDPFHRRETGFPLDDVCKMARRECLLFRIILHRAMLLVFLVEREQEGHQHLPLMRRRCVVL